MTGCFKAYSRSSQILHVFYQQQYWIANVYCPFVQIKLMIWSEMLIFKHFVRTCKNACNLNFYTCIRSQCWFAIMCIILTCKWNFYQFLAREASWLKRLSFKPSVFWNFLNLVILFHWKPLRVKSVVKMMKELMGKLA